MSKKNNFIPPKKQQKQDTKKPIFWVLFFLIIFWTVSGILGVCSFLGLSPSSNNTLTVKADSAYNHNFIQNNSTLNILDYDQLPKSDKVLDGITISFNELGYYVLNGVHTVNDSRLLINKLTSSDIPIGYYSIAPKAAFPYYARLFVECYSGNNWVRILTDKGGENILIDFADYDNLRIYLRFWTEVGTVFDNFEFKPMINYGSVFYPFSTPISYFYNQGVSTGTSIGREFSNYFYNSTLVFNPVAGGNSITYSITDTDYVFGGIKFSNISLPSGNYNLSIYFSHYIPLANLVLSATGNRSLFYTDDTNTFKIFSITENLRGTTYTDTPARFTYLSDYDSYGLQLATGGTRNSNLVSIDNWLINSSDLNTLTLYQSLGGYDTGYKEGYYQGKNDYLNSGFQDGYDKGKADGKSEGYNDGLEDASNYSFLSLMTAVVDAPIQALTKMFGFELLGVNLFSVISGLFTVCVILVLLRLLLGGGLGG